MIEDDGGKISLKLWRRLIEANIHGPAERQRRLRAADVDKIAVASTIADIRAQFRVRLARALNCSAL